MSLGKVIRLVASCALAATILVGLSGAASGGLSLGELLDPVSGLYKTARNADLPSRQSMNLPALADEVTIIRDERGVPHIFARSDRDAIIALGLVVAQDRLFQLDFIPRVASGRLSEVLGPAALETDRFMRSIGMDWGARKNAARIDGSSVEADLVDWYCSGVNAFLDATSTDDLPFEMRLLGYRPDRCTSLQVARVLQFMAYDLTFKSDEAVYGALRAGLSAEDYAELYPIHAPINDPIIPGPESQGEDLSRRDALVQHEYREVLSHLQERADSARSYLGYGFEDGKGSNNWAVAGRRSATGAPLLAGDMHLRVSLPAIWYEAHLVTPSMNVYGVTIPGAPGLVEAFNSRLAWAFTNTGADQIDHIALETDEAGTAYRTGSVWNELRLVPDTIQVKGIGAVVDTLRYSVWGPIVGSEGRAVSLRWVAHDSSRTLRALWKMAHSKTMDEFDDAERFWDSPMQNVLYADVDGNISIRSAGTLPIRSSGIDGAGLVDGSGFRPVWEGRVPFDELPFASNPAQGYLASANQEPAADWYPHYLGHDWRSVYRALRINEILRASDSHSVEDFRRYQSDVVAVHGRQLAAILDTVECSEPAAEEQRMRLRHWSGEMSVDATTPLAYDAWLEALGELAWDEPVFHPKPPYFAQLFLLLAGEVDSKWADIVSTRERETVSDLVCRSLELSFQRGVSESNRTWGEVHRIVFRHMLSSDRFSALGRGPFPYPGTWETLSPAKSRLATHSASWRVVVDLSKSPPAGYGVYPGGASGNPFSSLYDTHIPTYLNFQLYSLHNPASEGYFASRPITSRLRLIP